MPRTVMVVEVIETICRLMRCVRVDNSLWKFTLKKMISSGRMAAENRAALLAEMPEPLNNAV